MATPEISYHFRRPEDMGPELIDEIAAVVEAGGVMGPEGIREKLARVLLIGYAQADGRVVGTMSLKEPRPEYLDWVKSQSGLDLRGHLERGYLAVLPEFRGRRIGATLIEGLTERAGDRPIYVVVGHDNRAAHALSRGHNTHLKATYYSPVLGKEVGIWVQHYDDRDPGPGRSTPG